MSETECFFGTENYSTGDHVTWITKNFNTGKKYQCSGFIESFKVSIFGGKRKSVGATVLVSSNRYWKELKKRRTFISLSNLTKVK